MLILFFRKQISPISYHSTTLKWLRRQVVEIQGLVYPTVNTTAVDDLEKQVARASAAIGKYWPSSPRLLQNQHQGLSQYKGAVLPIRVFPS